VPGSPPNIALLGALRRSRCAKRKSFAGNAPRDSKRAQNQAKHFRRW
jgi:hypothetical protein